MLSWEWLGQYIPIKLEIKAIIAALVIIAGMADAIKYHWEKLKIVKNKSSRDCSRKFVLAAVLSNIVILVYVLMIKDIPLILIKTVGLFLMCDLYMSVYRYYPYKNRKKRGWKRPNIVEYTWNAVLPNNIRVRL